jgi:hypothetical protein
VLRQGKNPEALIAENRDTGRFWPLNYHVGYVAIPSDPKANRYTTTTPAGMVGGAMGGVNAEGLAVFSAAPGNKANKAWGVVSFPLYTYILAYSDTADQAAQLITTGTPAYRAATGRKTVLHGCGMNMIFASPKKVLVVEYIADRYAFRYPGDMGEVGNYICAEAGFYWANYSFDENNTKTNVPMRSFGNETETRIAKRFWTRMWQVAYNYGTIDRNFAMESNKAHYIYLQNGTMVDFNPDGTPINPSICRHSGDGGNMGGTTNSYVWVIDDGTKTPQGDFKTASYWVQGQPCRWEGPWDYVNLYMYK